MTRFIDEITAFLEGEGFECSRQTSDGTEIICTHTLDRRHSKIILPMEITAASALQAAEASDRAYACVQLISTLEDQPLIITEDRWRSQKAMTRARILAHLELFNQAFARNCEIRRIEKAEARDFLTRNHSYGYAACRYHYGLFLKRQTGHLAVPAGDKESSLVPGMLIAVATFSNARKWTKGERVIKSYEWTRYASVPELRVSGGMGKLLKAFIKEVDKNDEMLFVGSNQIKKISPKTMQDGRSVLFIDYYDDELCIETTFICHEIVTIDTDIDKDYKIYLNSLYERSL